MKIAKDKVLERNIINKWNNLETNLVVRIIWLKQLQTFMTTWSIGGSKIVLGSFKRREKIESFISLSEERKHKFVNVLYNK